MLHQTDPLTKDMAPVPPLHGRAFHRLRWILEHWLLIFILLFGIFVWSPFLAPVFMTLGWTEPAKAIYVFYSFHCHQLAQRSFFLFGSKPMYPVTELPLTLSGSDSTDFPTLRNFIGSPKLGWKVAWSDRMVALYGSLWLASIVFAVWRGRHSIRPRWWVGWLLTPMPLDGITHWLSDLTGSVVSGFRQDNKWLAVLTAQRLPNWFYRGDALGSFNSWMRLSTGICFGIAVVWLSFPTLDRYLHEAAAALRLRLSVASQADVSQTKA